MMRRRVFLLFLYFLPAGLFSEIYDLNQDGFEQYQDIFLNGRVVKKASRHERFEDRRFQILDSILSKYTRPFTMLDVGASQGYFTFRSADKYPESVFVMLEGSNGVYPLISKQLQSICQENKKSKNVIWLNKSIYSQDFVRMAECEHFDVILAQNILHWFPGEWEILLNSFLKMSHVTIIELPPNEKTLDAAQYKLRETLHAHLSSNATTILEGVPRHTNPKIKTSYYIFINEKGSALLGKNSLVHPSFGDRRHLIHFNFSEKKLIKENLQPPHLKFAEDWIPGINLITFLSMNGQYPTRRDLTNALVIDRDHKDWMPNNMIVQGHHMRLIDKGDPKNEAGGIGQNFCSDTRIARCKKLILEGNEQKVKAYLRDTSP